MLNENKVRSLLKKEQKLLKYWLEKKPDPVTCDDLDITTHRDISEGIEKSCAKISILAKILGIDYFIATGLKL